MVVEYRCKDCYKHVVRDELDETEERIEEHEYMWCDFCANLEGNAIDTALPDKLHAWFIQNRHLNFDTLECSISVDCRYGHWITYIADIFQKRGRKFPPDWTEIESAHAELVAKGRIVMIAEPDGFFWKQVERIIVRD